jgi:mRNA interferase HigB
LPFWSGGRGVRVISKRRLVEFWESRKTDSEIAERTLMAWYKLAIKVEWGHFGALRQTFGSADQVGNCVVFDVGNNRFRLIGRINYGRGIVYVLRVMDHAEYDRKHWIDDCGCRKPPPKSTGAAKMRSPNGKPTPEGPNERA